MKALTNVLIVIVALVVSPGCMSASRVMRPIHQSPPWPASNRQALPWDGCGGIREERAMPVNDYQQNILRQRAAPAEDFFCRMAQAVLSGRKGLSLVC